MKNELRIFQNSEFGTVRTIIVNGKEYFYGVDVARALKYERPSKAVSDNCKGILIEDTIKNDGGYPEKLITEGDMFSELEPKGKYFDAVCDTNLFTNFRDAAKELGMSQSQFIGWLKREKYIYSTSSGELRPMEPYRQSDLFKMKSYVNPHSGYSGIRTLLTPKGVQTFKLLLESDGIIPDALPKYGGRKRKSK